MSPLLKRTRIDSGKTIEEAASYLKIKKQYLRALEEGELDLIPAKVYVRGYLKLYSDYLGIPLDLHEEDTNQLIEARDPNVLKNYNQIIFKYKWKKHLITVSIITLVIIQLIFLLITTLE